MQVFGAISRPQCFLWMLTIRPTDCGLLNLGRASSRCAVLPPVEVISLAIGWPIQSFCIDAARAPSAGRARSEAGKERPWQSTVNFHGEERCNDTHESKRDPEARLARKSSGHES